MIEEGTIAARHQTLVSQRHPGAPPSQVEPLTEEVRAGAETIERLFARQPALPNWPKHLLLAAGLAGVVGATAILAPGLVRTNDNASPTVFASETAAMPPIPTRHGQDAALQRVANAEPEVVGETQPVVIAAGENRIFVAGETAATTVSSGSGAPPEFGQSATIAQTTSVGATDGGIPSAVSTLPVPSPAQQETASANAGTTTEETSGAGQQIEGTASTRPTSRGVASAARRQAGSFLNSDYPTSAKRAKAEGTVGVSYTVSADGSVGGCTITKSSGRDDLDRTTCRVIEQRFRYAPARTENGEPVTQVITGWYDWFLKSNR